LNELVRSSIVWDNHACLPLRPHDERFLPQLERFRTSGVTVVCLNVGFDVGTIETHVRMLAHFRHWVMARPDEYLLVTCVKDIYRAKQSGRLDTSAMIGYISELTGAFLARYDRDGNPIPDLAVVIPTQANGGISEDGKTIT
jgi:hypothetical protein